MDKQGDVPVTASATYAKGAPRALRAVLSDDEIAAVDRMVGELATARTALEDRECAMVADLRGRGLSWAAIGWFWEVSGEAVRQRWSARLDAGVPDAGEV